MTNSTMPMCEALESRRLLDGTPIMFIRGEGTGDGDQKVPAGWTMTAEMHPDSYPSMVLTNANGDRLELPTVKADGSVSITGTQDADRITVERVETLGASVGAHWMGLAYFQTPDGAVAISQPFFDPAIFEPFVQQTADNIKTAQEHYDDAVAAGDDLTSAQKQLDDTKRINRMANAALAEIEQPHNYIHYQLAGFYDIYVEMTDQMTAQSRIRIDGGDGNDEIAVSNNVPMKASLGGGPGADKITSGSKTSMLYGGGGSDRLFSRSKHGGTLDGGTGADRYYNRYGEVRIMARPDGDSVVVNNSPVHVAQCETLGVDAGTGNCYFLNPDGSQTDLLA